MTIDGRLAAVCDTGMNHMHHHHDHFHEEPSGPMTRRSWLGRNLRYAVATIVVCAAILSASLVLIGPGQAVVITRFGDPIRVFTKPGLAWQIPAPVENKIDVDLRLRTTSSGLQDVGTREGLRILVQAYVAWQVPDNPDDIRQFLRAVRNQPEIAGEQLRSLIGSSLEITASSFDLASLVNTDPKKIQLDQFERQLRERLDEQALKVYGITIRQVGIERLTLPEETLTATVERMKAERATVAAERSAEGQRVASQISSDADRDSRVLIAKAKTQAADIDAKSRVAAADIYGEAYEKDPQLYALLRSLDTLDQVVDENTRLILRTDAPPFNVLTAIPGLPSGPTPAPGKSP
ncbi:MAG TPA: protease modulator HflC [Methylovirgula sp.]